MKRLLLVVIGALLLSGCTTSSQSNSQYSADDLTFAEMMIPHHEQAIEISEIAFLKTSNPDVLQLAKQIKDAQSPEIEIMKSWTGVKLSTHAGHMMDGMLSNDELSALRDAQGKEFNQLFLRAMIKHHEGAIKMAKAILDSTNKDVADLGSSVINVQELEISKMKELLLKY